MREISPKKFGGELGATSINWLNQIMTRVPPRKILDEVLILRKITY